MKARVEMKRAFACLAAAAAVFALSSCGQESIKVTTYHFERGGDLEFVCYCDDASGNREAAPMEQCLSEEEGTDCRVMSLVLQVNRDEIGIVDLRRGAIVDSDVRVPFNTFNHTGRSPSDIAVTPDGKTLIVTHVGERWAAIYETDDLLGEYLTGYEIVPLSGPSSAVAVSVLQAKAYIALPEDSAVAVLDLADVSAGARIYEFPSRDLLPEGEGEPEPSEDVEPTPDGAEETLDALEDAGEISDATEEIPDGAGEVPDAAEEPGDADDAEDGVDTDGDAAEDTRFEDAAAEPDAGEDGGLDAAGEAGDADEEEGIVEDEEPFHPWHFVLKESEDRSLLVVSGSGSGGVFVLDTTLLESGIEGAVVARLLRGLPVERIAVSPDGDFLYAVGRDDGAVHVVDMATGLEVDTSRGNPLASEGALELEGRASDVVILELDFGEDSDPRVFRGVFAFIAASDGGIYAVDIRDDNCTEEECPSHVLRNANDEEDSRPLWSGKPVLETVNGQVQYVDRPPQDYPVFDLFESMLPDGMHFMYGVSFFPYDPWEGIEEQPDVRRAVTQEWKIVYEGELPYAGGIGGNVEPEGVFSDSGLPFCAVGVREGDVLVIDDAPAPLEGVECTAYVEEVEALEYDIVEAYQYRLVLADNRSYPLPSEECFPFAVKYHVRTENQWIVFGSSTGYLHDWTTDEDGRCADRLEPCRAWGMEDCTLLNARAGSGEFFVNPFLKFMIMPPESGAEEKDTAYYLSALSGFDPLSVVSARLPVCMKYLAWNECLYVSDAASEGLVEISLEDFHTAGKYF